jgi:hypothetical protein
VFGVKESLIVELGKVGDIPGLAEKHGVSPETKLLKHDFVHLTDEESHQLRTEEAWKAARKQGDHLKVVDGRLVPKDS